MSDSSVSLPSDDADILTLLEQRLEYLQLPVAQASRDIFRNPRTINQVLNGSSVLGEKMLQRLLLDLRITENQTLLRQWLKAWFIYRLRDSGALIWRKTGW